jgi:hypothetical protein
MPLQQSNKYKQGGKSKYQMYAFIIFNKLPNIDQNYQHKQQSNNSNDAKLFFKMLEMFLVFNSKVLVMLHTILFFKAKIVGKDNRLLSNSSMQLFY